MRNAIATAALATALAAGSASATIPSTVMTVTAANANGNASWDLDLTNPNGLYIPNIGNGAELFLYQLTLADSPVELRDSNNNNLIGLITQADVLIGGNPGDLASPARIFAFAFTVRAIGDDTAFDFAGNDYGLDTPYGGASGFASTAYTLTDADGTGATLDAPGYGATYNGSDSFFTGSLPSDLTTGAFGSTDLTVNDPADFSNRFIGPVSSITANGGFILSGDDAASINTQFFVVPSPASAALIGLGGLVATRRRR